VGFLFKHYEKLILSVFLLIFVASLIWLIFVFQEAKKIKEQDVLYVPQKKAEFMYKNININDYNVLDVSLQVDSPLSRLWYESSKRNPNSSSFTDFICPFKAIKSPLSGKIFPLTMYEFKKSDDGFEYGHCPDKDFDKIVVEWKSTEIPGASNRDPGRLDSDNDGIPDETERKFGMNPNDANDVNYDLDGDGFTNIVEIKAGTNPNDPKSHPPLAERLAYLNVERRELPFKIVNVQESGTIQAETYEKKQKKTKWLKVGDEFVIGNETFKVCDFKYKTSRRNDVRLKDVVEENVSEVFIARKGETPLIAKIKSKVFEQQEKIILKDLYNDNIFNTNKGSKIVLGDDKIGHEEYQVLDFDLSSKIVRLQDKENRIFFIKPSGQTDYKKPEKTVTQPIINNPLGDNKL